MKLRTISIISTVVFSLLLAVPTVTYFLFGEQTESVLEEKRELVELPSQFDNDYFRDLESWYTDHIPYRISLISFQKKCSQLYERYYRNHIHPLLSAVFAPYWYSSNHQEILNNEQSFLAPLYDGEVIYGRRNWLFYAGDESESYYTGSNVLSEKEMMFQRSVYEKLNNVCNEKGIRLVIMVAPNKEQVYSEFVPSYFVKTLSKKESTFYDYMADSGVKFLYPLDELVNGRQFFETYYMQDTHWNQVGAFLGAMEIYKALNMPNLDLNEVDVEETTIYGGDLSNMCGYSVEYTDYMVNYEPFIEITSEISQDDGKRVFTANKQKAPKLVMIGDSFADRIINFLKKDFSKSTILRSHYMNNGMVVDSVRELSNGDVLLLLGVERYDNELIKHAETVIEILERS